MDADVVNQDSNYQEKFWDEVNQEATDGIAMVTAETRKTLFHVCTGMTYSLQAGGRPGSGKIVATARPKYADNVVEVNLREGEEFVVYKFAAVVSSENHPKEKLMKVAAPWRH